MIHHISKLKDKNLMIISDTEKASYKIQHPLMIKMFLKMGIYGTYFNVVKAIH